MADLGTFEGFRDWLMGVLFTAVLALAGLVRKLDVGEINRRLDELEKRMDRREEGSRG